MSKTQFFEFHQNNSGGSFVYDNTQGISVNVIIEAADSMHANLRAEDIGIYFGGDGDCDCCGDRWFPADGNGEKVPSHYGKPVNDMVSYSDSMKWIEGYEIFVHYLDGRIEGFWK